MTLISTERIGEVQTKICQLKGYVHFPLLVMGIFAPSVTACEIITCDVFNVLDSDICS